MEEKFPKYEEISFANLRTISISERKSKESVENFSKPVVIDKNYFDQLHSMPDCLASKNLKRLVKAINEAKGKKKELLWLSGAHVIKLGLAPIIIQLAENGFITSFAANGALGIHDVEIALFGKTSECVGSELGKGNFGTTKETADFINKAIFKGSQLGYGYGESIARALIAENPPYAEKSILYSLFIQGVPITLHTILGAEVNHIHPSVDDAAIGITAMRDFRRFCSFVSRLENGVLLGWGSAVVMPEVFLKSISAVRNLGYLVNDFYVGYFDMIFQYRPNENVVKRPTTGSRNKGFYFIGHHEIMMPLLASILLKKEH